MCENTRDDDRYRTPMSDKLIIVTWRILMSNKAGTVEVASLSAYPCGGRHQRKGKWSKDLVPSWKSPNIWEQNERKTTNSANKKYIFKETTVDRVNIKTLHKILNYGKY
jgi:hypothetical protein